ncbi:hypothetical protein EBT23_03555 [bacterium]|nr:hypothetical protein [bacterium]
MPASGSRAAPLRGLSLQLYTIFVHPIFQAVAVLACALLFYHNRTTLRPMETQRSDLTTRSNNLLVEKNQLIKLMPSLRVEDLERQLEALGKKVVQNENQANGEAKKIARAVEESGWTGEVRPEPAVLTLPEQCPFLKHYPFSVRLESSPGFSEKQEQKDQVRLFRFMREVERTRKLHFLRRLEVEADPARGTTVKLEYDFYSLENKPRG